MFGDRKAEPGLLHNPMVESGSPLNILLPRLLDERTRQIEEGAEEPAAAPSESTEIVPEGHPGYIRVASN